MIELPANLRHRLILARDLDRLGLDDRDLRRRRETGELVRIRRGCYLPRVEWEAMSPTEQHIARAHAVAANASIEPVFTHVTAAALHGIPTVGMLGPRVHVTIEPTSSRRRQPDLFVHALPLDRARVLRIDGLLVSSVERTLVDQALTSSFQTAVVSLDWALAAGIARSELHAALEEANPTKRQRAATAAIEFADPASGSPGESLSRGVMHLIGAAPPELQVPISDARGLIGVVDFYWPEVRLVGEFDGRTKYTRDEFTGGRTPGDVVFEEKTREDRMRATGRGFVRWGWREANDSAALTGRLRRAGVPGLR